MHENGPTHARFASALRELGGARDIDEMLQRTVDLATELVPGIDIADVMFVRGRRVTVPVSTHELARQVDALQEETGEGPCLTAIRDEPIVVAAHLATDDRWPKFAPRAAALGLTSVVAYGLFIEDEDGEDRMGALNLFGRHAPPDDAAIALGTVFAAHCSALLKAAIATEGLQAALASRDLIGQAKGVLMARHQLTAEQAYDRLRQSSQDRNVRLRDLAEDVTNTGQLPD